MNKLKTGMALLLILALTLVCIPQSAFAIPPLLDSDILSDKLKEYAESELWKAGILKAKDPEGRTWLVTAPASALDALNGADTLKIEKNAKGNYVAKLFKGDAEISSKGLLWVYQPIPAGVTAKKIKVDGVETTFYVVGDTWKYAAEFKN